MIKKKREKDLFIKHLKAAAHLGFSLKEQINIPFTFIHAHVFLFLCVIIVSMVSLKPQI